MKRRLFGICLLCIMMMCATATTVHAADAEAYNAADVLYDLGLFSGTGTKADGTPDFDLDRAPTRHEAVTMLVSLLGKREEALAGEWETPFTDVADWAKPFVGYAYENGLTSGTSATTYSGDAPLTAAQYFTFVLKALGYETGTDFQWDKSFEFAAQIGLTDGRYANAKDFLRGDVTIVSRNAMDAKMKGSNQNLAEELISEGVFTAKEYKSTVESPLVLQPPTLNIKPVVEYAVNGEMLDRNKASFRTDAGTYVITPYVRGERCDADEYEVEVNVGRDIGTVSKNPDGTFTVYYSAEDEMNVRFWYDLTPVTTTDANGNKITYMRRSANDLSFDTPFIPKSGLVLDRDGANFFPGQTTGTSIKLQDYFVMYVYYDGVRIQDCSVTAESGAPFTTSIQADGSLLIMNHRPGEAKFTITYRGESATFGIYLSNNG